MDSDKHAPGFVPGHGYSREDWDEVCDNPEPTPEDFAESTPLVEAMPDLVSLRLDKDVLATLRAGGSGWQSRANEMLRQGFSLS